MVPNLVWLSPDRGCCEERPNTAAELLRRLRLECGGPPPLFSERLSQEQHGHTDLSPEARHVYSTYKYKVAKLRRSGMSHQRGRTCRPYGAGNLLGMIYKHDAATALNSSGFTLSTYPMPVGIAARRAFSRSPAME